MCLNITSLPAPTAPTFCYKVYNGVDSPSKVFCSPYRQDNKVILIPDNLIISSRVSVELTPDEEKVQTVEIGIHVFRTLEEAWKEAIYWSDPAVIAEVECRQEDWVAYGYYRKFDDGCAVFKQVKFVKIVKTCAGTNR